MNSTLQLATAQQKQGLRSIRRLYFFLFAGIGCFFTFLNIYYRNIGLSGTQIGLINTIGPLVGTISATFWGMLTDRFGKIRLILGIAVLGAILSVIGLWQASSYPLILLAVSVLSVFSSTLIPLVDSTTLNLLGESHDQYGSFRVFGTVGFMITSSMAGFLYERFGLQTLFPVYTLILAFFLAASRTLPDQPVRIGSSIWSGMNQMVRQPAWMLFAASVFLLWLANSGVMAFLGITLKAMGGSDVLVGLSWMVQALPELFFLPLGARLLRKYHARRLLAVAFVGYTLRTILYTLMPSPYWVLGINLIQGLSFVCYWVGAVAYANELAPHNLKATSQGMLFSIQNFANVGGALLCGWLFDNTGPTGMFQVLAIFCAAALVLFVFGRLRLIRETHNA